MTSTDAKGTIPAAVLTTEAELKTYGITRTPVDYFHYGNFRYTNVLDAIAAAKRDQGSS